MRIIVEILKLKLCKKKASFQASKHEKIPSTLQNNLDGQKNKNQENRKYLPAVFDIIGFVF